MKDRKNELQDSVRDLLEQTTAEEAASQVWETFNKALEVLEPQSLALFEQFLKGKTLDELGAEWSLSPKEIETWIASAKREVLKSLRQNCKVRQ
jgi:DNA-directed RNA polymerase specialized sigma24 family protein